MILQDLSKNYRRKNTSPRCALNVDISKAYDTVDWDFLEDLLNAYNLSRKFVNRFMIYVRNTSYSLLMNGRVQGNFKGAKGLRQGDPIYPLLFVLIMEYLTRL
uniref:Reverse transcriptase domain-containing protein n=1 Tax=Cannabis sativa TaxID=3483 RepID=A0A803PYI9_CANSA